MKKKVWPILLVVLIVVGILGGCGKKTPLITYGFQPPLEQLSWGMSIDEALSALHLTEDDVTLSHREDTSTMSFGEEKEIYQVSGDLSLQFTDDRENLSLGLTSVLLQSDAVNLEDAKQKIVEQLGEEPQSQGENTFVWASEETISSVEDSALKQKLQEQVDADESIENKQAFSTLTLSVVEKNGKEKIQILISSKPSAYFAGLQKQGE